MSKTLVLPVTLSEKEHLTLALEMSSIIRDAEEKEAEKKRVNAAMTEEINKLWATIHDLNGPVHSGKEDRDVEVEERLFLERGEVEIWRLDTDPATFYMRRPLSPDERQLTNGLEKKARAKKKAAGTEEQLADSPEEAEEIRAARLMGERLDSARLRVRTLDKAWIVLPTTSDDPADKYAARIGPMAGFPWAEIVEALGETEQEAADALVEKCAKIMVSAEAAAVTARQERILARFGELFRTHVVSKDEATGLYTAKIETEDSVMEASDVAEDVALAGLRYQLIAQLEAAEPPAAPAPAPAEPKGPTLLKAPKGAKAAKAAKDKKADGVQMQVTVGENDYAILVRAESDGSYLATSVELGVSGTGATLDDACEAISLAIAAALSKNGTDETGLAF